MRTYFSQLMRSNLKTLVLCVRFSKTILVSHLSLTDEEMFSNIDEEKDNISELTMYKIQTVLLAVCDISNQTHRPKLAVCELENDKVT